MPARSAVRRWRKIVGPTFGVGIALAIVFALLNIAGGNSRLIYGEYQRSDANLYVISRGGVFYPVLPGDSPGTIANGRSLVRQIRAMPGVQEAIGIAGGSVLREKGRDADGKKQTEPWSALGIAGDPNRISGMLALRSGRWIVHGDEIVVGTRLASLRQLEIGNTLTLSDRRFVIVGIGTLRGAGFPGLSSIYFDYDGLQSLTNEPDTLSVLTVNALDPETTAKRIQETRRLDVYTRDRIILMGENLTGADQVLYNIFSALGLAVAGLFVGNVLTMSVSERQIEFATMRAIGIRQRSILAMIMTEAFLIALVAYAVGCFVGQLLTEAIDLLFRDMLGFSFTSGIDLGVFIRVFAVDLVLAFVAGIMPARAALRVQPVEALREA